MSGAKTACGPLRLSILAAAELDILSAHLQDSLACRKNIAWLRRAGRFALVINRFRWEAAARDRQAAERVTCGLHFNGVQSVKAAGIALDDPEAFLHLLAIRFEAGRAPGGVIRLLFAGGGEIRLEVEAVDAHVNDLSEPWRAQARPDHGAGEET